mgnify:FL=1
MKFFGITQFVNAGLFLLVKFGSLDGWPSAALYIAALICWFLGARLLNRAWEQKEISHKTLMILSHASLLFAASMPYGLF